MAVLRQLLDSANYQPCDWDLRADSHARAYWSALFRWHLDAVLVPLIAEECRPPAAQISEFRRAYLAEFEQLEVHPERYARVDILLFTELRRRACEQFGFYDPFAGLKQRETSAALALLPELLAELDAASWEARKELLVSGLMAGNIFDLGCRAIVEGGLGGATAFRSVRAAPRTWLHNGAATWWRRYEAGAAFRHALFFVDNAGGDVVLGCLPLVRALLQAGARVTLAANSGPALNDITAAELAPLLESCATHDRVLGVAVQQGRLTARATGGKWPLLDLAELTEEFVAATHDADLIILHGMGRAVESNRLARFACDTLRTAMIKDEAVAAHIAAAPLAALLRFDPRAG